MAIYKPSNCTPFLDSVPPGNNNEFSCEIHTSNTAVTGYDYRILDSANNVLKDWNGLSSAAAYNGEEFTFSSATNLVVGYNQPYKWQLKLAQGNWARSSYPDDKWYDMIVASGKVMGSTPNRIQSKVTNQIIQDYWVQLNKGAYGENATQVEQNDRAIGSRVNIIRYDSSFGYIYPQEGEFTQDQLNDANYVTVFKYANDPEYIESNYLVDYATTTSIKNAKITIDFFDDSGKVTSSISLPGQSLIPSSSSKYYYLQTFDVSSSGVTKAMSQTGMIRANSFDTGASAPMSPISFTDTAGNDGYVHTLGATRLLFKNEGTALADNSGAYSGVYNGVFILSDLLWETPYGDNTIPKGDYTFRVSRTNPISFPSSSLTQAFNFTSGGESFTSISVDTDYRQIKYNYSTGNNLLVYQGDSYYYDSDYITIHLDSDQTNLNSDFVSWFSSAISSSGNFNIASTLTIKWERAADADTWADIMNKAYFVQYGTSAGLNYENNAGSYGVIDSTPLVFSIEKPIEIYPVDEEDTSNPSWIDRHFAPIYKNTTTSTYITPFTGINTDMKFRYNINNTSQNSLIISSVDNDSYKITHAALSSPLAPGTAYKINSFYTIGDEIPFYVYNKPSLSMSTTLIGMTLTASGNYSQSENKGWVYYYWTLEDLNTGFSSRTTDTYDGTITATFDGLQTGHTYNLTLTVEDELHYITEYTKQIAVSYTVNILSYPIQAKIDCSTDTAYLNFKRGAVALPVSQDTGRLKGNTYYPKPSIQGIAFNNSDDFTTASATIANIGTGSNDVPVKRGAGLYYDKAALLESVNNTSFPCSNLAGPDTTETTLNSQHIMNSYFAGDIYKAEISTVNNNSGSTIAEADIAANLPDEILIDENDFTYANPDRYKMYANFESYLKSTSNRSISSSTPFAFIKGQAKSDTWGESAGVVFSLVPEGKVIEDDDPYDYLFTERVYSVNYPTDGTDDYRNLVNSVYNSDGENAMICFPIYTVNSTTSTIVLSGLYTFTVKETEMSETATEAMYVQTGDSSTSSTDLDEFFVRGTAVYETPSIWSDFPLVPSQQVNNTWVNVEKMEKGTLWDDDDHTWQDNYQGDTIYRQVDANLEENHSGRQRIANKILTLNVALKDYDPSLSNAGVIPTISARCFLTDKEEV